MKAAAVTAPAPLWPGLGRLAAWVGGQRGWRRLELAFAAGLLSGTAFPPLGLVFLLVPAFVTLMWQLDAATRARQALLLGWCFAAGQFLVGLYWVGIAMTVDFERFWWFLPISVLGLSGGLALFVALVAWAAWRSRLRGPARILLFAGAWLLAEWTRSWLLSGFPWNLLGSVWTESAAMLQLASLTGVWGLSVVTLLAACAPALLAEAGPRRRTLGFLAATWGLLLATLVFGLLRLSAAPPAAAEGPLVRIVQPSVPQSLKWDRGRAVEHVERLIALSREPGFDALDLVVWPETAVPFNLWRSPALIDALTVAVPPGGLLVTGAPRYLDEGEGYNALHVIDGQGSILATYDKVHLVPFGEYVPLGDLLGAVGVAAGRGSLSSGPGLTTLSLPGLPSASPLICYEVIFPGRVTAADGPRPGFLLNLTNDAWFGQSSGPYQHFGSARLRAVEEGLPLVRAANNGISALIDPFGRVLGKLSLNEIAVLDLPLPQALPPTLFARVGNWAVVVLLLILAAFACPFGQYRHPKGT